MTWTQFLTGMNVSTVLASGVVAAIAAAVVNGVTAWHRLRVEARDRKAASHDEQLRDAVVDLLAAELRRFRHGREVRDAIDEIVYSDMEKFMVRDPWERFVEGKNDRTDATYEMEDALGRLQLYGSALYEKAMPLLTIEHRSAKEGPDSVTERERDGVMATFLAAAHERLGITERTRPPRRRWQRLQASSSS